MTQRVTAIYEDGLLRPVSPLKLPEHSMVEIDILQIASGKPAQSHRDRVNRAFVDAGLSLPVPETHAPSESPISIERREELARLFSSTKPISELISEDREGR